MKIYSLNIFTKLTKKTITALFFLYCHDLFILQQSVNFKALQCTILSPLWVYSYIYLSVIFTEHNYT